MLCPMMKAAAEGQLWFAGGRPSEAPLLAVTAEHLQHPKLTTCDLETCPSSLGVVADL